MTKARIPMRLGRILLLLGLIGCVVFLSGFGVADTARADDCCGSHGSDYGGLVEKSYCQLEKIFTCASAGNLPLGYYRGRMLVMENVPCPKTSVVLSGLAWKGKHFPGDGTFINQFTFRRRISSTVGYGHSLYDGKEAIVMEYPPGSGSFTNLRDELRQIGPDLYIGRLYNRCPCPRFIGFMCLQLDPCKCANGEPGR